MWLCDPFWGRLKDADRPWAELLEDLADVPGIVFVFAAGDSTQRGPDKFHYDKITGLRRTPDVRVDSGIRSYALYFTECARKVLSRYSAQE